MKTETVAHPDSANACLAMYLEAHKEAILRDWRNRVRGDLTIVPANSLSQTGLTNRLPQILDDLTTSLRRFRSQSVAVQAVRNAEEHGATRWSQGYEISEVLRENRHLRSLLIYHLRVFEDLHPDFGLASSLFVSSTVQDFLDEMTISAIKEFQWSQLSWCDKIQRGRRTWEEEQSKQLEGDLRGAAP